MIAKFGGEVWDDKLGSERQQDPIEAHPYGPKAWLE